MTPERPWIFRTVLVLFMLACVLWIVHVPYAPRRLLDAVPREAQWVGAHHDVAGRWEQLIDNPLMQALLTSIDPGLQIPDQKEREIWQRILDLVARDELVLAYVPRLGPMGEEAWIMAGWLGGRSQRLRWRMGWMAPWLGLREQASYAGSPVWHLDPSISQPGHVTAFALAEGVVLGCHSADPQAMHYLLDTLNGRRPSIEAPGDDPHNLRLGRTRAAPDRGWIVPTSDEAPWGSYRVDTLAPHALDAILYYYGPPGPALTSPRPGDWSALGRLLGDRPFGLAAADPVWLRDTAGPLPQAWMVWALEAMEEHAARSIVVALLGEDFSGSLRGLRVPCVLLAFPVDDPEGLWNDLPALLDRWNARFGWGLVPRPLPDLGGRAFALEGTGPVPYSGRSPSQQAAVMLWDSWLVCASHAGALTRLVEAARADDSAGSSPGFRSTGSETPAAWLEFDLRRGAPSLHLVLTAYALQQMFAGGPQAQAAQAQSAAARLWLDALHPMEAIRVEVNPHQAGLRVQAVLGKEARDGS